MKNKTIFCILAFIITILIAGTIFADESDCRIIVDYVDKNTNRVIQSSYLFGKEGDTTNTEEKEIPNYKLVEKPPTEQYTFTLEKQYVKYFYKYISQGVTIKYLDRKTNNLLEPEQHIDGLEGDTYTSQIKTFDNYEYVNGDNPPYNATGTMGKSLKLVNYYYARKIPITINHIFGENGGVKTINKTGLEDDPYTTNPIEKPVDENGTEYKLDESRIPLNKSGTLTNPIEVNYYYIPRSKGIKINYIDLATGEQLEQPTEVEGWVGDEYTITPKQIEGYDMVKPKQEDGNENINPNQEKSSETLNKSGGYDIVENPKQETIQFKEDLTELTYYYVYKSKLTVKHIDEETENVLKYQTYEGHEGDIITTEPKEIEYYKLSEEPENPKIELTKEEKEVTYKYKKLEFNLKIEEKIETIEINETKKEINKDIGKIEIPNNEQEQKIKINYKVLVTNTGEISGSANLVKEIPEDFEIINISEISKNSDIQSNSQSVSINPNSQSDPQLASKNSQTENQQKKADEEPVSITNSTNPNLIDEISNIAPGQTKEYTITISNKKEIELGEKISKTKLENIENPAQYEETTKDDNEAETKLIVGIQTGTGFKTIKIITIIMAMLLIVIFTVFKLLF